MRVEKAIARAWSDPRAALSEVALEKLEQVAGGNCGWWPLTNS